MNRVTDIFRELVYRRKLRASLNFSFEELFRSDYAKKVAITNCPYTLTKLAEVMSNLQDMASMLEVVRSKYGKPIIVTSGYRCTAVNNGVNGVPNSFHTKGRAVDITSKNVDDFSVLCAVIENYLPPFTEYYYEINKVKRYIHIHKKY